MWLAMVVCLLSSPPLAGADDDDARTLGRAITQFAFDLYAELESLESSVFSPLGLGALLGMLVEGTKGDTQREIIDTLRLSDLHDSSQVSQHFHDLFTLLENHQDAERMNFTVASRLSPKKDLKLEREYIRSLMQHYDASVQELDFLNDPAGALRNINAWISNNTNGLIQEALKRELGAATILVLMNAIYFKGAWAIQFPKNETRLGKFHGVNGQTADVAMMSLKDVALPYRSESAFTAVALPYASNETCMLLVVPRAGESLQHAMAAVRELGLEELLGHMPAIGIQELQMPRFQVKAGYEMGDTLQHLGTRKIFSGQAEMSPMFGFDGPMLSTVTHSTSLHVTEEGTEAASASLGVSVVSYERVSLVLDRPFAFLVYDKPSQCVMFMGTVMSLPPTDDPALLGEKAAGMVEEQMAGGAGGMGGMGGRMVVALAFVIVIVM